MFSGAFRLPGGARPSLAGDPDDRWTWLVCILAALTGMGVFLNLFPKPVQDLVQVLSGIGGLIAIAAAFWYFLWQRLIRPRWRASLWCRRTRFSRARLDQIRPQPLKSLEMIPLGESEFVVELRGKEPLIGDTLGLRFVAEATEAQDSVGVPTEYICVAHAEWVELPGNKNPRRSQQHDGQGGYVFQFEQPYTIGMARSTLLRVKVWARAQWSGGFLGVRLERDDAMPIWVWIPARTDRNSVLPDEIPSVLAQQAAGTWKTK